MPFLTVTSTILFDCSKVLVNHTVKTVFGPLLARVNTDDRSSDEDVVIPVQVCCFICVASVSFLI